MNFLKWIIALPLIVGAVLFALANPQEIKLTWSPLHAPADLPLYFIVLTFLGSGFLLGVFMAWVGMHKTRAERRAYKKDAKRLEKDLEASNAKLMEALSKRAPELYRNDNDGSDITVIESSNND